MANLGELLSTARQQRGLPLDEAARQTRIRADYIAALEQNQFQLLPGDVYARGFVRNYALFLGIPVAEAIAAYEETNAPLKKRTFLAAPTPTRREPDPIRIEPLSPTPVDTRLRYAPSIGLVSIFALVLLIVVYFGYNTFKGQTSAIATPTTAIAATPTLGLPVVDVSSTPVLTPWPTPDSSGEAPLPTATSVAANNGDPNAPANTPAPGEPTSTPAANAPAPTLAPTPSPTVANSMTVDIQIQSDRADAWVRVEADGKVLFAQTLARNSTRTVTATSKVRIRTGRADIVRIKVNGVDKGLMGGPNQMIITKEWDAAGNETIVTNG